MSAVSFKKPVFTIASFPEVSGVPKKVAKLMG